MLTDRDGGRRMFIAVLSYTLVPLVLLALWHDSFAAMLAFGFLLGVTGASFAVGVPFVSRWYPDDRQGFALGVYGMGMGGTVLAGLTAPAIAEAWGLAAPFWVAAAVVAVVGARVLAGAPATRRRRAARADRSAIPAPPSSAASPRAWALTLFYFLAFGGFVAMFLYLPKLLTGVHDLSKTDAGARAAGFALLAVIARPAGGWLADRIGAERVLRVSLRRRQRVLAIVLAAATSTWCR